MPRLRVKPFYQVIDGVERCPLITPDRLSDLLNFVPKRGDIMQFSYPKAGAHWLQFTVQTILQNGEPVQNYDDFTTNTCLLDYIGLCDWDRPTTIPYGLYMSHVLPPPENFNPEAKYLYIARNPWDCCVSLYHMVKALDVYCFQEGTFEDFFECFLQGDFGYGDYFEHLLAGYSLKDKPNVLFLTYEDMKRDTRGTVMRIARFLGESYARALENNKGELLEHILQKLTVDRMRGILVLNLAGHKDPRIDVRLKEKNVTASEGYEGCRTKFPFVRKGEVGGWKSYYSAEQLRRMGEAIVRKTRGSDVMDLWGEIREEARRLSEE